MVVNPIFFPTLHDMTKRKDPNGSYAKIVESLEKRHEWLWACPWRECNGGTVHRTTARTGVPEPAWVKYYQSIQPSKSTTAQITTTCGRLADYCEPDAALVDDEGENAEEFRLTEDIAHLQGFENKAERYMLYGNEDSEPEAITGITTLFSAKAGAENGDNIILADAAPAGGDNTSIWLMVLGPESGFGIVPQGSVGGWNAINKGRETKETADGMREVYRTYYEWKLGFCVRDWRQFVRIANIDVSQLTKTGSTGSDLIDCCAQALEQVNDLNAGTPIFLGNRKTRSFLRRQIANKVANATLQMDQVFGRKVLTIDGVPFLRSDEVLLNEAAVA